MDNLSQILKKKLESITQRKSNLSTQHQVEAVEMWNFLGKNNDLKILLRLAKLNLPVFLRAKQHLKTDISDGILIHNKFRYFLWLYKYYRNRDEKNKRVS